MLRVRYSPQHPPLVTLCVSALLERGLAACVPDNSLQDSLLSVQKTESGSEEVFTDIAAAKLLCTLSSKTRLLYPAAAPAPSFADASETACIDTMLSLATSLQVSSLSPKQLGSLSSHLQLRTFLCGFHLSLADLAVYTQLRRHANNEQQAGAPPQGWKNESLGEADLLLFNKVFIDRDDAALCEDGEEVTLMHWGNCIFDKVVKTASGEISEIQATLHLEGDFRKTKKKLHWLANLGGVASAPAQNTELVLREYDHLITVDKIDQEEENWEKFINRETRFDTPAVGDPLLKQLKEGDLLQLERRGYFRVDKTGDQLVLIKIPDGRSKAMSAVGTKVDAAKLSGAKITGKK